MEKKVILIMLTVGIIGGISYYAWYRRKRLAYAQSSSNSVENSVEPRVNAMEDASEKSVEYINDDNYDADKDEEDLSAKLEEFSLQKNGEGLESYETDAAGVQTRSADDDITMHDCIKKPVKRCVSHSRSPLAVYIPPPARATSPDGRRATCKQPHPPMDVHCKKQLVNSPTKPSKKSINTQPHPSTPAAEEYILTITIPLWLVSKFVGKRGCSIKSLTQLSGAECRVLRHPVSDCSHTLCNIVGSKKQIWAALDLISQRFPEVTLPNYPNMKSFHRSRHKPATISKKQHSVCTGIPPAVIPSTQFFASISHINSLSSIWVHVVNSSAPCPWQELYEQMNSTYTFASACEECSEDDEVVSVNQFYAVKTAEGNFARGLVKGLNSDDKLYKVMLVDHGNHINVTSDKLVQLRCACRIITIGRHIFKEIKF